MKQRVVLIGAFACITALICNPTVASSGAMDGITLCIKSVIPSLFPFIFLTSIISSRCDLLQIPLLKPVGRLIGVPHGSESLLMLGWIGGYPVGAKSIYDAYRNGQLPRQAAVRMLGFCNNAGPSFIFGILHTVFSRPIYLLAIWLIQIISSVLTGIILPKVSQTETSSKKTLRTSITQNLASSMSAIATISGWIILFRVMFAFLNRSLLSNAPSTLLAAFLGLLELTNGCILLPRICNEAIRFIICNILLAFGGLCVTLQTKSVVKELDLRWYFPGKLIQGCIAFILSIILAKMFF